MNERRTEPVSPRAREGGLRNRLRRWSAMALSVPIYFKVLGIGFIVVAIFGVATLFQLKHSLPEFLASQLRGRAVAVGRAITAMMDHGEVENDPELLERVLHIVRRNHREIERIAVLDEQLRLTAGSGPVEPAVERAIRTTAAPARDSYLRLPGPDRYGFDLIFSLHGGPSRAWLWLRVRGEPEPDAISPITTSVLVTRVVCAVLGQLLALWLSGLLTRPIRQLIAAADAIAAGDFSARAPVHAEDEIGQLARSFNHMARTLENYRQEVGRREAERMRLLSRLVNAHEAEKRSLAKGLHDHFGQSMSMLLLLTNSLRTTKAGPERIAGELEERIRAIMDDIRNLSYSLRPAVLDDYGLDSAVRRHVETLRKHAPFDIQYRYVAADSARLPADVEIAFYRIVQEALTNVLRHAGASNVSIVIHKRSTEAVLFIEDDGCGFDVDEALSGRKGLGLLTMQERATVLGGSFLLESEPGSGTQMRVTVPVEGQQP